MKKMLTVFGVLAVAMTVLLGWTTVKAVDDLQALQGNPIGVTEKHGFKVLDNGDTDDITTIVAVVMDNDVDGDGYVIAVNMFDSADEIAIDKESFKKGDIVQITFNQDDVENVTLNTDNIKLEVAGQDIK